jgi:hypothetical protein
MRRRVALTIGIAAVVTAGGGTAAYLVLGGESPEEQAVA